MNYKRMISAVLAVVMLFCCLPYVNVTAASTGDFSHNGETSFRKKYETADYEYWTLKDSDGIALCKVKKAGKKVVIPERIGERAVEYLFGDIFGTRKEKVREVILPDSLVKITKEPAFWYEGGIKDDSGVFAGCINLEKVSFGRGLKAIDKDAFRGCVKLKKVYLKDTKVRLVRGFTNCPSLEKVLLPEGCSVTTGAFTGCKNLDIDLSNCKSIWENAFENCCFVNEKMTFGKNLVKIASPLKNCSGIKNFSVSKSNKKYASKDGVIFTKDMTKLVAYPSSKKGEYIVPDKVGVICENAFAYSKYLEKVKLSDTVLEIREGAFSACKKLKEIKLSKNLLFINSYAFSSCRSLRNITIPESTIGVGYCVFNDCDRLEKITIKSTQCRLNSIFSETDNVSRIIYGYDHSTAQSYAEEYERITEGKGDISFSSLGYDRTVKNVVAKKINKTSSVIKWKKVKNAKAYEVYISEDAVKFKKAVTTEDTQAQLSSLKSGSGFYVKVRAVRNDKKYPFSMVSYFLTKPNIKNVKISKTGENKVTVSYSVSGSASFDAYIALSRDSKFHSGKMIVKPANSGKAVFDNLESGTWYAMITVKAHPKNPLFSEDIDFHPTWKMSKVIIETKI